MNNPVHLSSTWSSALIPFCAFKTNLDISGNFFTMPGITFPVCSLFFPTVLEGQLCYKLKLDMPSSQGKRNQLMLILDNNEERSLQLDTESKNWNAEALLHLGVLKKGTLYLGTAFRNIQKFSPKIHINTLSPFVHFGGGIFKMTSVKKINAKSDFLNMPSEERKCDIDLQEDCKSRNLFETCNCIPWEMQNFQV